MKKEKILYLECYTILLSVCRSLNDVAKVS